MSTLEDTIVSHNEASKEEKSMEPSITSLEVQIFLPNGDSYRIPSISSLENIATLRVMMSGLQETAFYTMYKLYHVQLDTGKALSDSDNECDEYSELVSYLEKDGNACAFKMVFTDYNQRAIKEHLNHLKEVLQYPNLPSAVVKSYPQSLNPTTRDAASTDNESDSSIGHGKSNDKDASSKKTDSKHEGILGFSELFESLNLGKFPQKTEALAAPNSVNSLSSAIKGVFLSGWNPPLPKRKLMGDILYLEASVNEGSFHITATAK